jgi:CHAT domain-containing protein/tetratricopeptide (TPR) repeat protein
MRAGNRISIAAAAMLVCAASWGTTPFARAETGAAAGVSPRARAGTWEAGAVLLDAGRNDEAASHFERALARDPGALELAEGLIASRARLCAPDTAIAYCRRMLAALEGARRGVLDAFLAGAAKRRERGLAEAAASFRRAAALAEASGDTLSATIAARARAMSFLNDQDGSAALEASVEYRRLARAVPSERLAADADAVEAECLGAADRLASADSAFAALLPRARERGWRGIESRCLSGVGRLDDKRQRNAGALERYREALVLERAMGDPERIAVLLNGVGQIEVRARSLDDAAARFKEAEETAVSCGLEWILGYLYYGYGAVAEARGNAREAIRFFQRSLSLHGKSRSTWGELGAHLRLGYLRGTVGEYAQAIKHYEFALAHYEGIKSLYGGRWALAGLAVSYHRLGDFAAAETHYRRALEASRDLGDRKGAAWALNSLGMLANVRGRCREALSLEHEAMEIYEELGDRGGMGEVHFSMGSAHFNLGDYARALEHFDRSFVVATELGDHVLMQRVASGMGSVYAAAGRFDLARSLYEQCLEIARRSGDQSGAVWALNNLASLAAERGDIAGARSLAAEALRAIPARGQDHLRARALYLLAKTERGERAIEYLHQALALADSSGLEELKWKCLSDLGELLLAAGDTAQAYSYQHRAVVSVESLRRLAGPEELRRHLLEPAIQPYERIVNLLLLRSGRASDAREALSYTERSRAQTLAALLREAMGRSSERGSERLLAEERDILSRLAFYQSRLQSGALDPEERADILERIEAVERRFSKLSLEFENGGRPHSDALYPRVEQPDELLAALAPGERMLSYFLGERRSFLFSATGTALEVFVLPPRPAIESRVATFLGLLRQIAHEGAGAAPSGAGVVPAFPPEVLEFASRELFDLVLGPVAERLAPGETLVIVPDGLLARLPFALLRNGNAYLVEEHDIAYAPSLRTLSYLRARSAARRRSDRRPGYDVIAVGASGESAGGERVYPHTRIPVEPLAEAAAEARMVGSLFNRSMVLTGRGAGESAFKESPLYDTSILHIAAHAYVDDEDLRRSFIVFNPERSFDDTLASPSDDGLLQWHEVASLRLNAPLVTLSACRSAGGELARGEGITGFTQAFLYAGAGCVLAAQLDVPDRLARDIMEEYYRGVRRGMGTAAALAAAQRACLARGGAAARPAVWGAFSVIGDGAAAPKRSGKFDPSAWLAFALIALIAGAVATIARNILKRRRSI